MGYFLERTFIISRFRHSFRKPYCNVSESVLVISMYCYFLFVD